MEGVAPLKDFYAGRFKTLESALIAFKPSFSHTLAKLRPALQTGFL
jgi:hypothetical protein